jgi:hypothetical protein
MRQLYTDVSALQNTNHALAKTNTNEVAGFNRKAAVEIGEVKGEYQENSSEADRETAEPVAQKRPSSLTSAVFSDPIARANFGNSPILGYGFNTQNISFNPIDLQKSDKVEAEPTILRNAKGIIGKTPEVTMIQNDNFDKTDVHVETSPNLFSNDWNYGWRIVGNMKDDPDNSYEILKSAFTTHKDNPRDIVSAVLKKFTSPYDHNLGGSEIASSPQEACRILISAEGKEVPNAICGTIHGVVMQALNDCGIEAAVVKSVARDSNSGHATLMYKVGEGQYIFNDYGHSVSIEAPNVLEAIKSVHKNNQTGDHSNGFVTICNAQGNMTEYALTDIAVFGSEVDKYSDIMQGLNTEQKERVRGFYIATNGQFTQDLTDFAATLGYTWDNKHGWINLESGVQTNGDSNMANESRSFGAKLHTFFQGELAGITFGFENKATASGTNHTTGNSEENAYNHNTITLADKAGLSAEKDIFNNDTAGRFTFRIRTEANVAAGIVPSNDEDETGVNGSIVDAGLNFGGGLSYTKAFGGSTFAADVSTRWLLNYNHTFIDASVYEFKLDNMGYQVAGGLSIRSNNQQGLVWKFSANAAYMQDANQSRSSAAGELNLSYLNPAGISIDSILSGGYEGRNISGMFNETIDRNLVFNAGVGVTLNDRVKISAEASQKVNLLVNQALKISPDVTLGITLRPK